MAIQSPHFWGLKVPTREGPQPVLLGRPLPLVLASYRRRHAASSAVVQTFHMLSRCGTPLRVQASVLRYHAFLGYAVNYAVRMPARLSPRRL
jgi:hypothetical protein